jgi:hypothetical protein
MTLPVAEASCDVDVGFIDVPKPSCTIKAIVPCFFLSFIEAYENKCYNYVSIYLI